MLITWLLSAVAVVAAYLLGSIPFGFLIAKWAGGIDIRTVGSGNIGATNVGRTLGTRYFFLVFVLDALKGFGPVFGFPYAMRGVRVGAPPFVPVLIAVAAILGHNFPIYLGFKGGKGVATSVGALAALDPLAAGAAIIGFVLFLVVTAYVSLSALLGAIVFVGAHFLHVPEPFDAKHAPLSVATIVLLVLMFVRHRKNLVRIGNRTEPKVRFGIGKHKPSPPAGKVYLPLVVALGVMLVAGGLVWVRARPAQFDSDSFALTALTRTTTPHQRSERLEFSPGGEYLAVTCPRYNRLLFWKVARDGSLTEQHDLGVGGRGVAVRHLREAWVVLVRPGMDARHLEPGWWDIIDFTGAHIGTRFPVGFDPDDLAVLPGEKTVLVLLSGNAEGERQRHAPCLIAVDVSRGLRDPRIVSRLEFIEPGDDPDRIAVAADGVSAAVSLRGSNRIAFINLTNHEHPRLTGSVRVPDDGVPGSLAYGSDGSLTVADMSRGRLWTWASAIDLPKPVVLSGIVEDVIVPKIDRNRHAIGTLIKGSELEIVDLDRGRTMGLFPLRGAANLARIRPAGMAWSAERGLIAVANSSGGSVHLVQVRRK